MGLAGESQRRAMRRRRRKTWRAKPTAKAKPSVIKITPTGQANEDIHNRLTERHFLDILIKEAMCAKKTEVDAGVTRRRLDYWAISISWRNPEYIGYEVKCSRADFLADQKTHHYEGQCSKFIWVTAPGVVKDVSEIPEGHGWQELSETGKSLITRKKAPIHSPNEIQLFNAMKSCMIRHLKPFAPEQ